MPIPKEIQDIIDKQQPEQATRRIREALQKKPDLMTAVTSEEAQTIAQSAHV